MPLSKPEPDYQKLVKALAFPDTTSETLIECINACLLGSCADGTPPMLHLATTYANPKAVELLLTKYKDKVDVNAYDSGQTPLICAVMAQSEEIIYQLLKCGADVNLPSMGYRGASGNTPLHVASYHGAIASADILVKNGANLDPANQFGLTPLHAAVCSGEFEMVRHLWEQGAELNTFDTASKTPLSDAESLAKEYKDRGPLDLSSNYKNIADFLRNPPQESRERRACALADREAMAEQRPSCSLSL